MLMEVYQETIVKNLEMAKLASVSNRSPKKRSQAFLWTHTGTWKLCFFPIDFILFNDQTA